MPLLSTSGIASSEGFGGGRPPERVYIEDVFSTYLYTGNGSTQTITNGIDLAGEGGLIWVKSRSASTGHFLNDTARSLSNYSYLSSETTGAESILSPINYLNNGFTLPNLAGINTNGSTYASWTFRKQPKFFDVVTWTGNGVSGRVISHSLGSAPGAVIIKATSTTGEWWFSHRLVGTNSGDTTALRLNSIGGATNFGIRATTDSATSFTLQGTNNVAYANTSGVSYVAYLFAHDAGGFGLTGTDNVISCGSFITGSTLGDATVNLGYELQWLLIKENINGTSWQIIDTMRGFSVASGSTGAALNPNSTNAENSISGFSPNATGFSVVGLNKSATYIYIAIRRGPMKVPTSGTEVFAPLTYTGNSTANTARVTGILTDMVWSRARYHVNNQATYDRLRGSARRLASTTLDGEVTEITSAIGLQSFAAMSGYIAGEDQSAASINFSPRNYINWAFRRAPGFFDVVCYTGTGANRTVAHNLAAVPELMIVKRRSTIGGWVVYSATSGATKYQYLDSTIVAVTYSPTWNNTAPTSSVFTVGTDAETNGNGSTFVAYLFGTVAGVSKVGSYTGAGSGQNIDCGFTSGARFVMIKRTDQASDWYVWDTARGIVPASDPYLLLNSTAAEVTNTDWIDPLSSGFSISQAASVLVASGGTYIFLAIA